MRNQGRQGGFASNFQNNNMSQGWRGNQNQGFGASSRQPYFQQQQQQQSASTQDKATIELKETLEKFMQASMANQKNTKASIRNLETLVDSWQNN